jgi:peptidoglycan-associated lipoprotein
MVLDARYARAATQYLAIAGVNAAFLSTMSSGKERPLDPGDNAAARAKHRRDMVVVTAHRTLGSR